MTDVGMYYIQFYTLVPSINPCVIDSVDKAQQLPRMTSPACHRRKRRGGP